MMQTTLRFFPSVLGLTGVLCAVLMGAQPAPAAEIFWVSDPVQPGETVLVIGEDFGSSPRVTLRALRGAPLARTFGTEGLLRHGPQSLAFTLPPEPGFGAFQIEVEGTGRTAVHPLNLPVVYWVQGDKGLEASPGGHIRVFGRNITVAGSRSLLSLRHAVSRRTVLLPGEDGDLWEGKYRIPSELGAGVYELAIDNGLAGDAGLVAAGTIEVRIDEQPSRQTFDIRAFGAKGDGKTDDGGAIERAIFAAGRGGGIVHLPQGRYRLARGLMLPKSVSLNGASRELTALMFDDFATPPPALISGRSHFAVRDLSVFASNHRGVIVGIDHELPNAEKGHVTIERVRVRAVNVRGHFKPEDLAERYKASQRMDNDALRLGGANLRVIDNDILASGRSLALYDARGAVVSGNTLHNGRLGWVSLTGSDGVIFENNAVLGADLMSTGGGINVLMGRAYSRNVIYRNNRFERMFGWDREAITSDGGGGYLYGSAAAEAPDRIRISGEVNESWAKRVPNWIGAGFFILGGRGRGQWARIAEIDDDIVKLDRALSVAPDKTSVVTMTQLQQNYLFINNTFEDVGSAIQYYGTSIDHVAAGNRARRSFGFLASGRWYRHYQPSWFCQFIDNEVGDAHLYRSGPNGVITGESGRIALWGLQRLPNTAPLLLGGIVRRNRLLDGAYIEVKGGDDPSSPGVSDVLVENNANESGAPGLRLDKGVVGMVRR